MTDYITHSSNNFQTNFSGWNSLNRRNAIICLPADITERCSASPFTFDNNYFDSNQRQNMKNQQNFNEFQTFSSKSNDYSAVNKRRRAYGDAFSSDAPKRKIRITEEKMSARLRNFHISNNNESRINPDWFFVRRPAESLEDIDCRLSSDEDDAQTSNDATDKTEPKIELSKGFEDFLKTKRDERLRQPLYVQPSPCTDLVLWQPPGDFLRDLTQSEDEKNTQCEDIHATVEPYVTYPTTPVDETPATYFGKRRERRRFTRGPFIEDVSLSSSNTDDELSMDVDS